jgi:aspartate/methionine/tyrosine aminotransferase
MRIDTFKIEEWMNRYCPSAKYDLTTTCIEPLSIKELLAICRYNEALDVFDTKLTYGDIHGSLRLKNSIKSLYTAQNPENISVTHGAIGANQLVFESLLEKGDEVLSIVPTYQQHYSIPKSLGASVKLLFLREENNWLPNLTELSNSLTRKTRLICLNNPNNPTGAVIPDDMLERIVKIAKINNSWILSDEVYRGLNMVGNPYSKSIADIYEKGISVGSMSKTYSLPGLRVGWVCAREDLITEINKHREYNTISISILDDYFSAIALENREKIEKRNFEIMREGINILQDWLNSEVYVKANLPKGGTTALLRYKKDVPSKLLCRELQSKTGVALLPGETMEMEGTVRLGFCTKKEVLETGLLKFSKFLRTI